MKEIEIIDEITQIIKDNIQLMYLYRDDCLKKLRKYCKKNKTLSSKEIIEITDEALTDLIDTFLFDLRDIE